MVGAGGLPRTRGSKAQEEGSTKRGPVNRLFSESEECKKQLGLGATGRGPNTHTPSSSKRKKKKKLRRGGKGQEEDQMAREKGGNRSLHRGAH